MSDTPRQEEIGNHFKRHPEVIEISAAKSEKSSFNYATFEHKASSEQQYQSGELEVGPSAGKIMRGKTGVDSY